MLKSEIVPFVSRCLKTPLKASRKILFPTKTHKMPFFTTRHQKNYCSQQRKLFEANRKTPKPTV